MVQKLLSYSRFAFVTVLMTVLLTPGWAGADANIRVQGAVPKPVEWSVGKLQEKLATEVRTVEYASRGQKHTSHAIGLLAVLQAAGAPTELKMDPKMDPKQKNYPLRLSVVIAGHDGYTVTLALAELLKDLGNRQAWLALDADGQPFPEGKGHVR